jgi:CheY-like chemotaxis protein
MDDAITFADEHSPGSTPGQPWKILIADDEPSMHLVTKLALGDFTFEGRRLELLSAYGEDDTRRLLDEHPDTALVLLDVIMDTMDSGFTLVRYIRETLGNKDIRIIMRTGQSGNAPEDNIIINYDINDFKDKTELTVAKLRTTLISSLRTYSHLKIIAEEQRKSSANRAYLHGIIDSLSSVLITLDPTLKVRLWNREAEVWTGVAAAAATGRDMVDAAPVFAPLKPLLLEVRRLGRVERAVELGERRATAHLLLQTLPGSDGPEILVRLDQTSG